jgi:hypothetical protein
MHHHDTSRTTSTPQKCRSAAWATRRLKIMQEQVGHDHASTTSIYTCVSSDFRTRTLRRHLDATVAAALGSQNGGGG